MVLPPSMPLDAAHDVGEKLQVGGGRAVHPVLLGRPTDPPDRLVSCVKSPHPMRTYVRTLGGGLTRPDQSTLMSPQKQIEALGEVERGFVHLDVDATHPLEHVIKD